MCVALRHASSESAYSDTAAKFLTNIVNVHSIAAHFKPKIDAWSAANDITSITPEQVSSLWCLLHIARCKTYTEGGNECVNL